ncbi:MAG: hypothetical protein HWN65_07520 [Candidatus Helarchaeota archaeon]|nr:hypothetical protein [Candidatus Helarchaeota archaeon]
MTTYKCTRCDWAGQKEELKHVPVCPDCATGHSPLYRMMKKGDLLECPSCSWSGPPENALREPECPECEDQYLREE